MKKITLLLIVVVGCKKSDITGFQASSPDGYTVSGLYDSSYFFSIPQSGQYLADSTSVLFNIKVPPDTTQVIELYSETKSLNVLQLFLPSLNLNHVTFDSTSYYTTNFVLFVNGKGFFANSISINSLQVVVTPHVWPQDFALNALAYGTFDFTFSAVGSISGNNTVVIGSPLNETVEVKGKFENIFANQ